MICTVARAALAAAALGALAAARPHIDGCSPSYQCIYHWISDDSTVEYSWDFRPLCRTGDNMYIFKDAVGQNYTFNICGNTTTPCNGKVQPNPATHGVMIQSWDVGSFVPAACDQTTCGMGNPLCCEDREYPGYYSCCSLPCEVIAHTRPEFDLIDVTNPATGGILMKHSGIQPVAGDPAGCPPDPLTNYPRPRTLNMRMLCDPAMLRNEIRVVAMVENPVCTYTMDIFTGAACGALGDPFDPPQAAAATPGANFGYTVLGAFLAVVVAAGWEQAQKRGWVDALRDRLAAGLSSGGGGGAKISVTTNAGAARESDSRDSGASTPFGGGGYGGL